MYMVRTVRAGRTVEIAMYYTSRYGKKGQTRADWTAPTQESQKRANARRAERDLRELLAANFKDGTDAHIDFGYIRKRGSPYREPEDMKRDMKRFLKYLRKEYKKRGNVLKYVHVMEIGKKGSRHHHMVINDADIEMLTRCWKKAYDGAGKIHVSPLDTGGDYAKLAAYLIKYTSETIGTDEALMGKRYNCSRNLIRPEPVYRAVRYRNQFVNEPKPWKGYRIVPDSIERGMNSPEYGGYGFIRYRMVKLQC